MFVVQFHGLVVIHTVYERRFAGGRLWRQFAGGSGFSYSFLSSAALPNDLNFPLLTLPSLSLPMRF